jgi:hypothetical protein
VYNVRSNDLRISLANLVSQSAIYVAENVKDHVLFLKYATTPFVSKLDGVAAERLVTDYDEKMEGLIPEDGNEEFLAYRRALHHVAEKGGRSGLASKKLKTNPKAQQPEKEPAKEGEELEEVEDDSEKAKEPEKEPEPAKKGKRGPGKRRTSTTEPLATSHKKHSMLPSHSFPLSFPLFLFYSFNNLFLFILRIYLRYLLFISLVFVIIRISVNSVESAVEEASPEKEREASPEAEPEEIDEVEEEEVAPVSRKRHSKTNVTAASKKGKARVSNTAPLKIVESNKRRNDDPGLCLFNS